MFWWPPLSFSFFLQETWSIFFCRKQQTNENSSKFNNESKFQEKKIWTPLCIVPSAVLRSLMRQWPFLLTDLLVTSWFFNDSISGFFFLSFNFYLLWTSKNEDEMIFFSFYTSESDLIAKSAMLLLALFETRTRICGWREAIAICYYRPCAFNFYL